MILGVDYSSYEAVLCALPFEGGKPRLAVARFRPASRSGDDHAIAALGQVSAGIAAAIADLCLPQGEETVAWVERGYGTSRRADWILGAYFSAIFVDLRRSLGDAVNPIDLREWKKIVTGQSGIGLTVKGAGNGNAKKEVANEACRALLSLVEVDGSTWTPDELDAFGIAWAGRALNKMAVDSTYAARAIIQKVYPGWTPDEVA